MTSTFTDLSLLRPTIPSLIPSSFSKFTTYRSLKLCCSLTEGSATFLPFKLNGEAQSSAGHSATADCVIVGGGISGLCIAQALATNHRDVAPNVIVTEARDCVGGNITTLERDGYLWEEGPNSFQPSDPMLTMVVDSGSKEDSVLGDQMRRVLAGFGALGLRPPPPGHEEPVEEFVRRNLGDEVFERLIRAFFFVQVYLKLLQYTGVYAGDPSKINMKAAFGKVWNLERLPTPKGQTVGSLRKGLAMLPDAIATRLGSNVKLFWKLSSIIKLENGGAIYSSSLFPDRAPSGRILLLNYTESELVEAVDCDLRKMLINPNATDPLVLGVRVWPQAIPQFLSGHFDIPDAARDASEGFDCLALVKYPAAMFLQMDRLSKQIWRKSHGIAFDWRKRSVKQSIKRGSCPTRGLILETCLNGEFKAINLRFDRAKLTFQRRRHHDGSASKLTARGGEGNDRVRCKTFFRHPVVWSKRRFLVPPSC
ncbi:hypothetical protein DKX38_021143 [Salix brachista]|uniref:Protoporphyrinogen oxidase n=1 Tax=Salix brachista TaxID=2182728 RepID=A0A5N5K8L2_9ROSI|nr:hypothetical protein DKX38_021143 [Salix brachista]